MKIFTVCLEYQKSSPIAFCSHLFPSQYHLPYLITPTNNHIHSSDGKNNPIFRFRIFEKHTFWYLTLPHSEHLSIKLPITLLTCSSSKIRISTRTHYFSPKWPNNKFSPFLGNNYCHSFAERPPRRRNSIENQNRGARTGTRDFSNVRTSIRNHLNFKMTTVDYHPNPLSVYWLEFHYVYARYQRLK